MPWLFVPTELTTGSAAKFADHKTKESGFLSCAGPSAGGFTIPLATVLGQFGPKSNYECLYVQYIMYNSIQFVIFGLQIAGVG